MAAEKLLQMGIVAIFMFIKSSALIDDALECEDLNEGLCAYAVNYEGYRCMPDMKSQDDNGHMETTCSTSSMKAGDQFANWIESDECISECGLRRTSMTGAIISKLCSQECLNNCPNIADFYSGIGGGFWDHACKTGSPVAAPATVTGPAQGTSPAPAPEASSTGLALSPAPAPAQS